MKTKIFIYITIIAFFTLPLCAQQKFYFIPKAGLNVANISGTGGTDARIGMNVGLAVEWAITPKLSIEPGVFYSTQGTKFPSGTKIEMDYVNVPVFAKYYVFKGFNVYAGPQFGFNVRNRLSNKASIYEAVNDGDYIKVFDPALALGAGYQFDFGLNVSAGYSWSILNHAKKSTYGYWVGHKKDSYHNQVFQIQIGWRF